MWRKIHRNYLPILSGLVSLFMMAVVVLEIDRQIYQVKKKDICGRYLEVICPDSLKKPLVEAASDYFVLLKYLRDLGPTRTNFLAHLGHPLRELDGSTTAAGSVLAPAFWPGPWPEFKSDLLLIAPASNTRLEDLRGSYSRLLRDMQTRPSRRADLRPEADALLRDIADETSAIATAEQARLSAIADQLLEIMQAESRRIVDGDNPMIGITALAVIDPRTETVARAMSYGVDKFERFNSFENNLVSQRFVGEATITFDLGDIASPRVGELIFRHTTPLEPPELHEKIVALTNRYRWYLGGVLLFLGILYWYILRYLILPIRFVTARIDQSKGSLPEVLARPTTLLEWAYNDLARDALLTSLTRNLAEYMSVDRLIPREEILGDVPKVIARHFGFAAVYALEMSFDASREEPVRWIQSALHGQTDGRVAKPAAGDWRALGERFDWNERVHELTAGLGKKARPYFAVPIAMSREERRATFLAATPRGPLTQESLRWSRETLLRVATVVRTGLETLDLQRMLIIREKSKANISLARALGHDLTNVVATSKLELDTMRRFLNLPPERQENLSPLMRSIFNDSLLALLDNTKFLQEIINIYRSFSYLHHPKHESVDFNAVIDELVDLFKLSVSRHYEVRKVFAEGIPRGCVEPRLLKLAVFNLLTNATDALKRQSTREGEFHPTIWISTAYDPAARTVSIAVRDNGAGILNSRGEPASPDEIRHIFQAGFTTKSEGMAEGLGLNWVRQIVVDFHGGRLQARNVPEGGAEVAIELPLYEQGDSLTG